MSSAPPVTCPCCGHKFTPKADPASEGWSRRTGRLEREPWNKGEGYGGFWRRVRMLVAVVRPYTKGLSRRVEGWDWEVLCFDPDLVLYAATLKHAFERVIHRSGGRRTKLEAQQAALAAARELVELLERGQLELVWAHCRHGYTNRRDREGKLLAAMRAPFCPECRAEDEQLEREISGRRKPSTPPAPAAPPVLRLVRS